MASPSEDGKRRTESEGGCSVSRGVRGSPREDTPPAPCSGLCGPRSCSTLPPSLHQRPDGEGPPSSEPKRRRLWGLRGLVKMFRRRVKRKGGDPTGSPHAPVPTLRARSVSELTMDQTNRSSGGPYNQGLSVSHDSVFSPESPPESTPHNAPPALALATRGVNMAELKAALRRRRGGDDSGSGDDDLGLPLSPQTSPTTLDVLNHGLKSYSRTTQSTCSDGSLLSMGSSENDEDSFGAISNHSSNGYLLQEGRCQIVDHEPAAGAAPLSHKAARHKISVKPRRTHGVPRARRQPQPLSSGLPTTPEVNEDLGSKIVSSSPEATSPQRILQNKSPASNKDEYFISDVIDGNARLSTIPPDEAPAEEVPENEQLLPQQEIPRPARRQSREVSTPKKHNDEEFRVSGYIRKTGGAGGGKPSRQRSDPSHLQKLMSDGEVWTPEARLQNGSQRSSSVEGRLEGHDLPRTTDASHESKTNDASHKRNSRDLVNEEVSTNTTYSETHHVEETNHTHYTASVSYSQRDTASCYVGSNSSSNRDEVVLRKQSVDSVDSESTQGERSSTDSLTTTPLPGVYIRSNHTKMRQVEQNQASNSSHVRTEKHWREATSESVNSAGPLSLDSSLTLVHQEENLRKASSADHVSSKTSSVEVSSESSLPKPVLRSVSVTSQTPSKLPRSRNNSIDDELVIEADLNKVSLRPIKREPSFKRTDSDSGPLPEFMRIQLNKVQSKGNTVIFNTEHPKELRTESPPATESEKRESKSFVIATPTKEDQIERAKEVINVVIEEKTLPNAETLMEIADPPKTSHLPSSNLQDYQWKLKSIATETNKKIDDELILNKEDQAAEEIILRRPSVVDRSVVLDQSVGQSFPVPKKEEPELFKVFARRSFKLNESDPDSNPNAVPDLKERETTPAPAQPDQSTAHAIAAKISSIGKQSEPHQEPFRRQPAKRFSLGSSSLSYVAPTLTNIDPKPTVIILSSKGETESLDTGNGNIEKDPQSSESKSKIVTGSHSFKSLSSSQYAVYKSKASKSPAAIATDAVASDHNSNPITLSKSDAGEVNVEASRKPFNRFTSGVVGPMNAKSTGKKEEKQDKRDVIQQLKGTPRSPFIVKGSSIKRESSMEQVLKSTPHRTPSLPWQTQDAQTEEVVVSHILPTPEASDAMHSLPTSKILDSFSDEADPKSSKPVEEARNNKTPPAKIEREEKPTPVVLSRLRSKGGIEKPLNNKTPTAPSSVTPPTTLAEAKNSTFSQSFGGEQIKDSSRREEEEEQQQTSLLGRGGSVDDWRLLVRQRREDRRKQTKSPEAEEILIESTRPTVSRNSKVLEMASNFQKLQVA